MKTIAKFMLGLALLVCASSTTFAQEDVSAEDFRGFLSFIESVTGESGLVDDFDEFEALAESLGADLSEPVQVEIEYTDTDNETGEVIASGSQSIEEAMASILEGCGDDE